MSHYFRISLRHLVKNYRYTALNVLGLTVGFAVVILIGIYLHYETSFENFHQRADRIHRVSYQFQSAGDFGVHWARVPVDYVNALADEFAEVETLVRFQNQEPRYVRVGQEKFRPQHAYTTDAHVFQVFDFPLIVGNPSTALAQPHSVVLTESLAQRYFGETDVVGQEVVVTGSLSDEETIYTVTGVMADVPTNTHLPVEMLLSFPNEEARTGWAYVYALLNDPASAERVVNRLPDFVQKYAGEANGQGVSFHLQPLSSIHLESDLAREIVPGGSAFYVKVFFLVGIFILLVALINYVNLGSALSLGRAKEVGVRSVLGAPRQQVRTHLLLESVAYSLTAAGAGGGLAYLVFPAFHELTGATLLLPLGTLALSVVLLAILCGLVIGLSPALLLSSLRTLDALKQRRSLSTPQNRRFKQVMMVVQFGVAIMLTASAFIVYDQLQYLAKKDLGMETEQIIAIPNLPDAAKDRYPTLRDQISQLAGVQQVSACMQMPSEEIRDTGPVLVAGVNDDPTQAPMMDMQVVAPGFVEMMGFTMLAGESRWPTASAQPPEFTENYTMADYLTERSRSYLINETAMRQLGWSHPEEAVGQSISWSIDGFRLASGPITGVIQDYHQETLRNKVDPLVMTHEPVWLSTILIKVSTPQLATTLAQLQETWNGQFQAYPMEYHFLDELFGQLYQQERVQLRLLSVFSGLIIFIAFVGLFGLIAYSLRARVKEIAVRRVLGANVRSLLYLIGREYVRVMLAAGLLAIPLSYWAVRQWLAGFAYRVDISLGWYGLTAVVIGLLLLLTVGWHARRSAAVNPAVVLRDE